MLFLVNSHPSTFYSCSFLRLGSSGRFLGSQVCLSISWPMFIKMTLLEPPCSQCGTGVNRTSFMWPQNDEVMTSWAEDPGPWRPDGWGGEGTEVVYLCCQTGDWRVLRMSRGKQPWGQMFLTSTLSHFNSHTLALDQILKKLAKYWHNGKEVND